VAQDSFSRGWRAHTKGDVRLAWRRLLLDAEITDLHVHDLRHHFASVLASSGHSLPIIGALLGHSQPATTARYAHLVNDALKSAVEKAGAIITGK
jgi:site-specific recombinase XerD